MESTAKPIPAIPSGAPNPPTVAGVTSPEATKPAVTVPAGQSASESVVAYGGNRGGRPRDDGLVPGSPEAIAADREYNRKRKAEYRAKLRAQSPPVLPSAFPSSEPSIDPVKAPDNLQGPGAPPEAAQSASPPWTPEDIREIFDELIPTIEQECVASLTTKAAKAKLPGQLLSDIEKKARWSPVTKQALSMGVSGVGCKYLNQFGISSQYKPETILIAALTRVTVSHLRLSRQLDKLISQRAQDDEKAKAKPEPKKADAGS